MITTRDPQKFFENVVNFTAKYIENNMLGAAILGVSGGIDSTVVAAILNEVKERLPYDFNVYGISMPTSTTDSKEYNTSIVVGNAFCSVFNIYNIDDISDAVINSIGDSGYDYALTVEHDNATKIRRGNIKSRLRTVVLYNFAAKHKGFVVGTDNFTEKLLGFSTIGGDALADYMPIQFLWKTEVYELANYLVEYYKSKNEWDKVAALQMSIALTPQDGLGISQSDMEQIGAKSYFDVDEILMTYINECGINDDYSAVYVDNEFMNNGYKTLVETYGLTTVDKVLSRYKSNFKLKLPILFYPDNHE